nr:ribonuclease H-like domain-containing protein [Tanacetum cinerariifolium]
MVMGFWIILLIRLPLHLLRLLRIHHLSMQNGRDSSGMFLSQCKYAMEILDRAHMVGCNPSRTLVDTESKLRDGGTLRQPMLSRSTAEAEYLGVANAVAETCWIWNLLRDLHTPISSATIVYCDNVSAVYLSFNSVQHQRTKHIEIDIHFVRDLVATRQVCVLHVPSRFQYVDIFNKGLPLTLFDEFHDSLSVRCTPTPTIEEY